MGRVRGRGQYDAPRSQMDAPRFTAPPHEFMVRLLLLKWLLRNHFLLYKSLKKL